MDILPHRGPALLLDRVEVAEDGRSGTGYLLVGEQHCVGHFPGNPILRGVDRIEMAALTLCVIALSGFDEKALPLFTRCGSVRFSGQVLPGSELRCEVLITNLARQRKMAGDARWYIGDKAVGEVTGIEGMLFKVS